MILAMAMPFALAPLALARLTAFESDKGANQCDAAHIEIAIANARNVAI